MAGKVELTEAMRRVLSGLSDDWRMEDSDFRAGDVIKGQGGDLLRIHFTEESMIITATENRPQKHVIMLRYFGS